MFLATSKDHRWVCAALVRDPLTCSEKVCYSVAVDINEERVIFNKVGWMKYYGARPEDDAHDNADAGDARNFEVIDGKHRGHIQAKSVNLKRLGTRHATASFQMGVTVVSVATHPDSGAQFVVGWQHSCWAHASRQELDGRSFLYECNPEDAVILPLEARTHEIPSGKEGMGQTRHTFAQDTHGNDRAWVQEAIAFIEEYDGENWAA